MRNVIAVTALLFLLTAAGSATTMCANGSAVTAGFSCSVGGLTINVLSVTGVGVTPELNLVQSSASGDTVNLAFNPNIVPTDGSQELTFVYELTGGASTVSSTVTGVNASLTESACTAAFIGNVCSGTSLGSFTVNGSESGNTSTSLTLTGNDVFIMKDINVSAGGGLTLFTQNFTGGGGNGGGGGEVPEPVSIVLMGSGLLALSFLRKLRKA
jgi:hypothetical protein